MKRIVFVLLALVLLLSGCGNGESVVGTWEAESPENLGLHMGDSFVQNKTVLILLEDGTGAWEIEFVESRQILRREFTYSTQGKNLTMRYPDNTMQKFTVSFEDGFLHLAGQEYFIMKPLEK